VQLFDGDKDKVYGQLKVMLDLLVARHHFREGLFGQASLAVVQAFRLDPGFLVSRSLHRLFRLSSGRL